MLRKAGFVTILAFAMSTQILFSPTMYADFSAAEIFFGWLEQFLDALAVGACMLAAVLVVDSRLRTDSWWQLAALATAATFGAVLAMAALTPIHYPAGYYPSSVQIAGDTLRFAIPGA